MIQGGRIQLKEHSNPIQVPIHLQDFPHRDFPNLL